MRSKLLNDIRFWIVIFFLIRLIGITNPPIEVGHNWRQSTGTMVARNFLESDNNILYPRIDIAGEKSGITGMEFPFFNYMTYLFSNLFGYQHWYGRLINLFVSSIGIWFFFLLIRKYFTQKIAFFSSIILLASIWFQFSRKIMPDTFSVSLVLASLYYGTNFFESKLLVRKYVGLLSYLILLTIGVLSKLPALCLLVVFVFFIFDKRMLLKDKFIFVATSTFAMIPVLIWYFYWVPHLVEQYGFWHFFMGKNLSQGLADISNNLNDTFSKFYDVALKFIGFFIFLWGVVCAVRYKEQKILSVFTITFLFFCVFIVKAGFNFPHHNYYIIPFVPVMALLAGYGLSVINRERVAYVLLCAIVVEGIANQYQDLGINQKNLYLTTLESTLDRHTEPASLILINSGDFPTSMYFAHRKGWVSSNENIQNPKYVDSLTQKGLKYIVILKRGLGQEIHLNEYTKLFENKNYCIYRTPDKRG
jgi:4-amino-4-deoxy-L-arabinose transferase-like glycosyltransferase